MVTGRAMRLLPAIRDFDGWTAYAWLIYLVFFAAAPFFLPASASVRWLSLAATMVGVALYFAGYWLSGVRVLWVIGAFLVLSVAFARVNPAASVLAVYGACYCGHVGEPRIAFPCLGGVLAAVGLSSWLLHLSPEYWGSALFFSALMGAVTIH